MSFANDDMIGTIPPGFLAPADGNYAPNVAANVAQGASPAAVSDASQAGYEDGLDADTHVGAWHAVPIPSAMVDLGPNKSNHA